MYNAIRAALVAMIIVIVVSISIFYTNKNKAATNLEEVYIDEIIDLEFNSGWLPYWDYSNAKLDWLTRESKPEEIVSFAVVYEGEKLHVVEQMDAMTQEVIGLDQDAQVYISFTNDVLQEDGAYLQKDKAFLENFLEEPESRGVYIDDIIELTLSYGADGIEMDYENIKDDQELWGYYAEFVDELYEKCIDMGISLRVVLGYDSAKYVQFPEGPKYIIMCYNLFGPHSGPGPKADRDFLALTYEINEVLKPNVSMAFSNNGFSWDSQGNAVAINKREAIAMAKLYDASIQRDEESSSLYYEYKDALGESHEVWFADDRTLSDWMAWGIEAGYTDYSLWRYGE